MNAIIAVNPQQMQEAQATTISWVDAKLKAAEAEFDEASVTINALTARGLRSDGAKNIIDRAARRVKFYEKVKAALAAGYYIIPPFNIQLFAIRTDRGPNFDRSDSRWTKEHLPRTLPMGAGEYRNPAVSRYKVDTETRVEGDKTFDVAIYGNGRWPDEIELPVRALKPQIIEAVGQALELKIFDALGIAPAYRAADPIIAGQINRPDKKGEVLTFFVAWWLDQSDI